VRALPYLRLAVSCTDPRRGAAHHAGQLAHIQHMMPTEAATVGAAHPGGSCPVVNRCCLALARSCLVTRRRAGLRPCPQDYLIAEGYNNATAQGSAVSTTAKYYFSQDGAR
jgi:hypothetical protein